MVSFDIYSIFIPIIIISCIGIISTMIYDLFIRDKSVSPRSGFFTGTCNQPPDPILRGPYPASPSWDGLADTSEAALESYSLKYGPALGSY